MVMDRRLSLVLFLFFVLWRCDLIKETKTIYHSHKLNEVPYSKSVLFVDIEYTSGQIANINDDYNKIV